MCKLLWMEMCFLFKQATGDNWRLMPTCVLIPNVLSQINTFLAVRREMEHTEQDEIITVIFRNNDVVSLFLLYATSEGKKNNATT